jgi:hypothetical protein
MVPPKLHQSLVWNLKSFIVWKQHSNGWDPHVGIFLLISFWAAPLQLCRAWSAISICQPSPCLWCSWSGARKRTKTPTTFLFVAMVP